MTAQPLLGGLEIEQWSRPVNPAVSNKAVSLLPFRNSLLPDSLVLLLSLSCLPTSEFEHVAFACLLRLEAQRFTLLGFTANVSHLSFDFLFITYYLLVCKVITNEKVCRPLNIAKNRCAEVQDGENLAVGAVLILNFVGI